MPGKACVATNLANLTISRSAGASQYSCRASDQPFWLVVPTSCPNRQDGSSWSAENRKAWLYWPNTSTYQMQASIDDALLTQSSYSANGDETDELVLHEMLEIKTAIEIERRSGAGSWASWFSNRAMTRRLGVICLLGIAGQW